MKFFIQFGGQGAPWFKEFARYHEKPKMSDFYNIVIKVFEDEISKIQSFRDYYDLYNIRQWLNDHEKFSSSSFFSRCIISMPMIQVVQLAHLEFLRVNGGDLNKILENSIGATGHSQGLVTASMMALGLDGDDYYQALEDYSRFLIYVSLRSQEIFPYLTPTIDEIQMSQDIGNRKPEPMVAVLEKNHQFVEEILGELNLSLPNPEKIYVSLYNTPVNRILSGMRKSLIRFNEKILLEIKEKKLKYIYVKSSVPFHCPLLRDTVDIFQEDLKRINFSYTGKDLKIPVYSFFDGRNMQNDTNLGLELCKELMTRPVYWNKSLRILKTTPVDAILDFGPANVSQRLSQDTLMSMGLNIPIMALSDPKEQKELLKKIKY